MKTHLLSIITLFLFAPLCAQEESEEKIIQVEIVKNSSFEAADTFGNNELRVNFLDLLLFPAFHGYYERIIDENSSYGTGLFVNFGESLSSDVVQRRFAISPYYRLYFLNRRDYGTKGIFVEAFSSFATSKDNDSSDYDELTDSYIERDNIFRVSIGVTFGRKWISRSGYTYEPFVGFGRYLDNQGSNGSNPEAHIRFGLSIGKRY
ncbi:MAG: hypothetical protein P8N93_07310 [Flavobacteriaceae bacterium]|jgi:hypothetical protein|nr:hypothetical protein [Flavobacteriaceae bacterium]